jgi:hypothetical protein
VITLTINSSIIFVLLFQEMSLSTIIVGALTIFSTALTGWIQIEKPYERWKLYRKYHRLVDTNITAYNYAINPYNGSDKDDLLVRECISLERNLHNEWEGLLPVVSELQETLNKPK